MLLLLQCDASLFQQTITYLPIYLSIYLSITTAFIVSASMSTLIVVSQNNTPHPITSHCHIALLPRFHLSAIAGSGWLHTAPRYHQLIPISCHFQDCEALLFVLTTCKQRYIKYPGFFTLKSQRVHPLWGVKQVRGGENKLFSS